MPYISDEDAARLANAVEWAEQSAEAEYVNAMQAAQYEQFFEQHPELAEDEGFAQVVNSLQEGGLDALAELYVPDREAAGHHVDGSEQYASEADLEAAFNTPQSQGGYARETMDSAFATFADELKASNAARRGQ